MLLASISRSFGGKGSPFLEYQVANSGPPTRPSGLVLQTNDVARQVCSHAGGDAFVNCEGAGHICSILREYFGDAVDSFSQEVVRFLQFRRAKQTTDVASVEFDVLRRERESKIQIGRTYPESSRQNGSLSRPEKPLILARVSGNLAFPVAATQQVKMCWLLPIWMRSRRKKPILKLGQHTERRKEKGGEKLRGDGDGGGQVRIWSGVMAPL